MMTRVVSDGNGGLQLKDAPIEVIRKWITPTIIAFALWVLKGGVESVLTELRSLHDGQITHEMELRSIDHRLARIEKKVE
jgi:hypothetical protein